MIATGLETGALIAMTCEGCLVPRPVAARLLFRACEKVVEGVSVVVPAEACVRVVPKSRLARDLAALPEDLDALEFPWMGPVESVVNALLRLVVMPDRESNGRARGDVCHRRESRACRSKG